MFDVSAWAKSLRDAWLEAGRSLEKAAPQRVQQPVSEKAAAAPSGVRWAALALGISGFLALAALAPAGLPNGDAALYAQQAMALDFSERTVHLGYYIVVATLTGFSDSVPDRVFNWLSALAAGAIMALMAWAVALVTGRRDLGLLAALSLLGSYTFVRNAVWAEIYIFQAFFFLLACWLFWSGRTARAGFSLALSVLISPSMLIGVPALCIARPRWRDILMLGMVGGGIVASALAFVWRDFFLGPRGLMAAAGARPSWVSILVKEGFEGLYGVMSLLPFLALGLIAAFGRRRWWPYLAVLFTLWLPTLLFGERFADVPVQLPTWILLAPALVIGVEALEKALVACSRFRRAWLLGLLTAVACVPYLAIPMVARRARTFAALPAEWTAGLLTATALVGAAAVWLAARRPVLAVRAAFLGWLTVGVFLILPLMGQQNNSIDRYREEILALGEVADEDFLAVGSWEQGVLLEHYLFRRSYTGHSVEAGEWAADLAKEGGLSPRASLETDEEEALPRYLRAVSEGREVWLLASFPRITDHLRRAGRRIERVGTFQRAAASGEGVQESVATASEGD